MQENIMYLLCIAVYCASVLSCSHPSIRWMGGGMHLLVFTQIRPDIMLDYLDIMIVFPKQSFKIVILKKKKEKRTTKRVKTIML